MAARPDSKPSNKPRQGQLRIIGGQWRGRKLSIIDAEGLRPTGDRIRETLFNWLAAEVPGAQCLDLFAGTGALGLEALSRGAAYCDLVESHRHAATRIAEHLKTLACDDAAVHHTAAATFLSQHQRVYDLIFLDPPFHKGLLQQVVPALEPHLKDGSLVYLEEASDETAPLIPHHWHPLKSKHTGQVRYSLFEVKKPADSVEE